MFTPVSKLPNVGTTIFTVISQRAKELGAINLAQGFPDFAPPQLLQDLLGKAATESVHQYAPMTGTDALIQQVLRLSIEAGLTSTTEANVTITVGATEAIFSTILALAHPGDEVIVFDPCYDAYVPAVELCNARAVRIPLQLPDFHVDWQRVSDAINDRTRMIIINTPHNPSGAIWSQQDINTLADLVRNTQIVVLSDEVYGGMVFDGAAHCSVQAHEELRERSISVMSFGKLLHATGWRVGYALASEKLTQEIRRVHQFNTFSVAHPLQVAIAEFLQQTPEHLRSIAGFYQAKRDYFTGLLSQSKFQMIPTPATYFQVVDYSDMSDESDVQFADRLLREAGVATIPLSPFYEKPPALKLLRFCFAKREATLAAAAEKLLDIF